MVSRKILLRALLCSVLALVPIPDLENQAYDAKLRLLRKFFRPTVSEAVILEFHRDDFEALKSKYYRPIVDSSSGLPGSLYERFEELRNQFLWNEAVYQALLARILREEPAAVLVTQHIGEGLVNLTNRPELQKLVRDPRVVWAGQFDTDQNYNRPAAQLTGRENYGFLNLHPDLDGIVRRTWLVASNHASLPFRALLMGGLKAPQDITEPKLIDFAGRSGTVPTCSVLSLFDASTTRPCPSLAGKTVFLAPSPTTLSGSNLFDTPVGALSRAEVLANVFRNGQGDLWFIRVNRFLLVAVLLVHFYFLGWAILNRPVRHHLPLAVGILIGEMALSATLLGLFGLQVPVLPFALGSFVAYVAFLWTKNLRQQNARWQAERQTLYLRELDELKSNFLSLMSHDLKTPIAKVQALTERLAREAQQLTPDQKKILEAIQRSNDELARYILSILNFQRVESQELVLNRKSNDMNVLIEDVVERLRALFEDKKILVETELEPLFALEFDEQLIRQVLTNLIENAIKYNREGTRVRVTSEELGDFVVVSVSDNGVGIPEDQQRELFKKFSRREKSTAERVKGTGLGLYLARYFLELHGGSIEVESTQGQGTTFRFRLPIHVTG